MNSAESLKAKIKNYENKNDIKQGVVFRTYMADRFLERVSQSKYKKNFVLKGGLLIASIVGLPERATMDIDATIVHRSLTSQSLLEMVNEIIAIDLNDGVTFTIQKITPIREDAQYSDFRISLEAWFENIVVALKLDLTTGDVITPEAIEYKYPLILEDRSITIYGYAMETVLAEKFETVLRRSTLNTRMKDFYDIYVFIIVRKSIDIDLFTEALKATSANRGTISNIRVAEAIISSIYNSVEMRKRWENFQTTDEYASDATWEQVVDCLNELAKL
ncbi:MAG TPA: nucleotidyl transferase AbiEii/AbiGii toxin family protein [Acidimicrobiia bacterium]|nr:nucleotidyl transferase AbiEii/AbiGii toxin family protein [Acidimicrobiia bacterium]